VTFSPDGNTLTAREEAFGNWRIHVWHVPSWEEIEAQEKAQNLP